MVYIIQRGSIFYEMGVTLSKHLFTFFLSQGQSLFWLFLKCDNKLSNSASCCTCSQHVGTCTVDVTAVGAHFLSSEPKHLCFWAFCGIFRSSRGFVTTPGSCPGPTGNDLQSLQIMPLAQFIHPALFHNVRELHQILKGVTPKTMGVTQYTKTN